MDERTPAAELERQDFAYRGPGLSAKLLFLTIVFVMIAEVLVFVPSVSNFRRQWLHDRLVAAQLAALSAEAAPNGNLPMNLRDELLMKARVLSIFMRRADSRRIILNMDKPTEIDAFFDLRSPSWPELIRDAMMVYFAPDDRVIRVIGEPGMGGGEVMIVVMEEGPLKAAMIDYGLHILGLSIFISVITGALVYLTLVTLLVRPMMRLTGNIVRFREKPEDPTRIIEPSGRHDEIGQAEYALSSMENQLASTLSQKRRLAALGLAVSKVSHDLRNMLASVQLLSDRLGTVDDPTVQRVVPKVLASTERAIRLCENTLDYGHVQEAKPARSRFRLEGLVDEIADGLSLPRDDIGWRTEIGKGLQVEADYDQLFRVINNLLSNAVQALENARGNDGQIALRAGREKGATVIEIADNGPGVPAMAKAHLFEAFQTVARKGGTGLGLAIAAELIQAHGGEIVLVDTEEGATFRLTLPDIKAKRRVTREKA
ncbi:putative sensor histidine kinase TcrY [Methyloligella halotolerans]|uniref:histidine kinase n=1 Tax=Methyloligella halotolerans TaxID=1177755 RepID=A0A1E2RVA1_9HYPH|nr:HAMP domain-containing sensor histidine kinase [Methyloligella halotolerans]ODA65979.1 putative sensor histidine kinase TcrY [Methyloligella halotolerans]